MSAATILLCIGALLSVSGCGSAGGSPEEEALKEYQEGLRLQEQGNLERAFQAYSTAVQLNPTLAEAYAGRGYVHYRYNALVQAVLDLNRAIELDPRSAGLYLTRGRVYVLMNDTARATADLEQVLALTREESLVVPARQLLTLVQ